MSKNSQRLFTGILALSVLLRVVAAVYLGDKVENLPGTYDQISYHELALRVIGGHGFTFGEEWWPLTQANTPTAHWSFLYTFFLAGVYSLFGIHPLAARLIQALLLGLLHPLLAYRLGSKIFNPRVGLAAAGITAVYAYFIYYSAVLMTEPFYITAILGGLSLAIDWAGAEKSTNRRAAVIQRALAFGLLLGIAILLRQLFLFMAPFIFLWIWWTKRNQRLGTAIPGLALAGLVIILLILPFTFFNYQRFNRFVLLNTNAGYAFYWANHPIYGTHFLSILPEEMGSYQSLIPIELRGLDEAALDQELLRRGLGFVTADPGRYFLLSLSRFPAYFMFWPSAESGLVSNISRVGSFGLFLPLMLFGLVRSFSYAPRLAKDFLAAPLFLFYLFISIYTGIHILSWALIRYRLPVDAILVIFAGLAITDLYERFFLKPQSNKPQPSV